ncbi:hypothetical protein RHMOL_Rhmol06G0126500 [Rhododendron molle]|uniref:Uncharacterized protein n=1 Tax=Rhododendron molle TaxID=49168 RepID=A0ACC0NDM3_RHOML|nr:hypothetical protein RHMOL_Rhmol06G0126500 [Rhododendron molle]
MVNGREDRGHERSQVRDTRAGVWSKKQGKLLDQSHGLNSGSELGFRRGLRSSRWILVLFEGLFVFLHLQLAPSVGNERDPFEKATMAEEDPKTPLDANNQLGGGGDKSPLDPPRKPDGGRVGRTTSKDRPLAIHDDSRNKDGRTATGSTRRSKSRHGRELVARSKSMHSREDILDK